MDMEFGRKDLGAKGCVAGALVVSLLCGVAYGRDPNKVRCRAAAEDGARLQVRYEAERREFRADFQVVRASDESQERFASSDFAQERFENAYEPGDVLPVRVDGQLVGMIALDERLSGRLEFDAQDRPFPANFPPFPPGTVVAVGSASCTGQRR
jgi:hypothetical protein